jgi:hypothetical protein
MAPPSSGQAQREENIEKGGIMEGWNGGKTGKTYPIFHYSNIPMFHEH